MGTDPKEAKPKEHKSDTSKRLVVIVIAVVVVIAIGVLAVGYFHSRTIHEGPGTTPEKLARDARLTVNSAEWRYEDPAGWHTSGGDYYLWVNVRIVNVGSASLSVYLGDFNIVWTWGGPGDSATATWTSFVLYSGNWETVDLAFLSEGLQTPLKLQFENFEASVPTPTGPAPEIIFSGMTAEYSNAGAYYTIPNPGYHFLWLNFSMTNAWDKDIRPSGMVFTAVGKNGIAYRTAFLMSVMPSTIPPGDTGEVSLVFEVPTTWVPDVLHCYELWAPWADAEIPAPS